MTTKNCNYDKASYYKMTDDESKVCMHKYLIRYFFLRLIWHVRYFCTFRSNKYYCRWLYHPKNCNFLILIIMRTLKASVARHRINYELHSCTTFSRGCKLAGDRSPTFGPVLKWNAEFQENAWVTNIVNCMLERKRIGRSLGENCYYCVIRYI